MKHNYRDDFSAVSPSRPSRPSRRLSPSVCNDRSLGGVWRCSFRSRSSPSECLAVICDASCQFGGRGEIWPNTVRFIRPLTEKFYLFVAFFFFLKKPAPHFFGVENDQTQNRERDRKRSLKDAIRGAVKKKDTSHCLLASLLPAMYRYRKKKRTKKKWGKM